MSHSLQTALNLHQNGNYTAAKILYEEILETDPDNVAALHLLGILAAQEKETQLALQYLTKALEQEPYSPTLHNSIGNVFKNCGQLANALSHFHAALEQQPNNAILHNNIAIVQQKMRQDKPAIKHYQQAIELCPNYADAHYNLALLFVKQNNITKASEHLHLTIELQPYHSAALCQLAQIYQQRQQNDQALILYQKALKIDNNNVTAHNNLGTLLLTKNKFNAAIRHLKKALILEPYHQEAFFNLGVAFLRLKNPEAALKYFLRLTQFTQDFNVYYNLGVIYNDIHRTNDAIFYFKEALKLNEKNFACEVNLGAIYLKQQNYSMAIEHYNKALQLQPENAEIKYTVAALSQQQNQTAAPSEYLQNLFDNYAENYEEHLTLLEYQAPQFLYTVIVNMLNPLPNSLSILELGCGTGLCGEKIRDFANKLIGVDISNAMLDIAKQKNIYDELQQSTIERALPNYQNTDLIIAIDTFPYIGDLTKIFSLCKKSLKKQGFFIFTVEKPINDEQIDKNSDFILQRTLRFTHNENYIETLTKKYNFSLILKTVLNIRKQQNKIVESFFYILQC